MRSLLVVLTFCMLVQAQAATGFTKLNTTTITGTTFTDSTCPNQTTCYYQLTAVDSAGFESSPAPCGAAVLCVGGNIAVAVMPSSGTHTVAITWTASTTTGVTYNVYRHIGPLSGSNLSATVQ